MDSEDFYWQIQSMTNRDGTHATVSVVCLYCDQPMSLARPDIKLHPSPISETLGCRCLAPSNVAAVNDTISATLSDISELDHAITRSQAATKELQSKQTSLQSSVQNRMNLLNPIAHLPTEVLARIFEHCVIVPCLGETWPTCDANG